MQIIVRSPLLPVFSGEDGISILQHWRKRGEGRNLRQEKGDKGKDIKVEIDLVKQKENLHLRVKKNRWKKCAKCI